MDLSPDSGRLALGHSSGTLAIHDTGTGDEVITPISLGVQPTQLAFNPDGTKLAIASLDSGEIQIRDATTGDLLRKWSAPGSPWSLAWHPKGDLIVTGHGDTCLYLWEASSGQQRGLLRGHQSVVDSGLSFSPDGSLLLSTAWDGTCRLWDVWAQRELLRLPGMQGTFSQDGRRVALRAGRNLTLWEVVPGGERRTLPRSPAVNRDSYFGGSISPDGHWLAIGSNQGASLWDLGRCEAVAFVPVGRVHDVQFHPSGKEFFVTGQAGLFSAPMRAEVGRLQIRYDRKPLLAGNLERMAFDRDGHLLAVISQGSSGLWILDPKQRPAQARALRHPGAIYPAVSSDSEWIASGVHHGLGVKVWRAKSGELVRHLHPKERGINALFSPDGRQLLTATIMKYCLWNAGSWEPAWEIRREPRSDSAGSAAFTRDGKILAVVPAPSAVQLYDCVTQRLLARLQAPDTDWSSLILFSHDGALLVTVTGAGDAWVWDLRRVRERLREIGLDWDQPPYPPPGPPGERVTVEVDLGEPVEAKK